MSNSGVATLPSEPKRAAPARGPSAYTPVVPARQGMHLPALDGVRGLAVLVVIIGHLALSLPEVNPGAPALQNAIRSVWSFGWTGVDLFFVLSGFLITGILVDSKGSRHYFRNFYARRSLRIFPLYYGFLALAFVVLPLVWRSAPPEFRTLQGQQAWYWTYLSNVLKAFSTEANAGLPRMGHFWSLAIEEQFYLVWPMVVCWCSTRTLKRVCAVGIAGALLLRIGFDATGYTHAAYALMPSRMDALLLGALTALTVREAGGLDRLAAISRRVLPVTAAVALAMFAWFGRFLYDDAVVIRYGVTVMALFYVAMLVQVLVADSTTLRARFFTSRPLRTLGKYSYCLYVVHWPLVEVVKKAGFRVQPDASGSSLMSWLVFSSVLFASSCAIAWVSWHLYEKQWLKLKDRFPMEDRGPAARSAAGAPVAATLATVGHAHQ